MPKCCRRYGKSLAENKPLRWTRVYTLPDCVCFAKFSSPVVGGSAPQPTTGVPMFQPRPEALEGAERSCRDRPGPTIATRPFGVLGQEFRNRRANGPVTPLVAAHLGPAL